MARMWNNSYQDVDTGYDFDFHVIDYINDQENFKEVKQENHYTFCNCPVCETNEFVILMKHQFDNEYKVKCESCDLETSISDSPEGAVRSWDMGDYQVADEANDDLISFDRDYLMKVLPKAKYWQDAILN